MEVNATAATCVVLERGIRKPKIQAWFGDLPRYHRFRAAIAGVSFTVPAQKTAMIGCTRQAHSRLRSCWLGASASWRWGRLTRETERKVQVRQQRCERRAWGNIQCRVDPVAGVLVEISKCLGGPCWKADAQQENTGE